MIARVVLSVSLQYPSVKFSLSLIRFDQLYWALNPEVFCGARTHKRLSDFQFDFWYHLLTTVFVSNSSTRIFHVFSVIFLDPFLVTMHFPISSVTRFQFTFWLWSLTLTAEWNLQNHRLDSYRLPFSCNAQALESWLIRAPFDTLGILDGS